MYNSKTIFHLPGIFSSTALCIRLLEDMRINPQHYYDNIEIGSMYGCPGGIWNGGRITFLRIKSVNELECIKNFMDSFNIPIRLTLTNSLIEEQHLSDTYCNILLDVFNTGNNEILCNSDILENYIKNKYGDRYRYVSSFTKSLTDDNDVLNELKKQYHLIVLDSKYNKNFDFLKNIENKDNCEFLCNDTCILGCPNRKQHYEAISKIQLSYVYQELGCPYAKDFYTVMQRKHFISIDDINNTYLPMGFKNFKLEGRMNGDLNLIEIFLYYLVKDEYKVKVRQILIDSLNLDQ